MTTQPEAVKDLKKKSCTEYQYKTFLVSRSDAHDILNYIEELEGEINGNNTGRTKKTS